MLPVQPAGADALSPQAREIFGDQPKKIEVYEAEQSIGDDVSITLLREYDLPRDPNPLAVFVPVRRLDDTENW